LEDVEVIAYTFLGPGAVHPFDGLPRPPGEWLDLPVHLVDAQNLVEGLDDELWVVQAEEGRTRLLERVPAWDVGTAEEFSWSCVRSACALALGGDSEDDFATLESRVLAALEGRPDDEVLAFAADAFALARGRRPDEWGAPPLEEGAPTAGAIAANLGFVVAHVAGRAVQLAGGEYGDGFASERARQRAWLAERVL
jgi:hypothetical protein